MDEQLRKWIRSEGGEEALDMIDPLLAYVNALSYSASVSYQGGKSAAEFHIQKGDAALLGAQFCGRRPDDLPDAGNFRRIYCTRRHAAEQLA